MGWWRRCWCSREAVLGLPNVMKIRELELPPQFEVDLVAGPTLSPKETALLRGLLTRVDSPAPVFYGKDGIIGANRLWDSEMKKFYLGSPNRNYQPGDVDPRMTLIIGHAEPDSPIALDYRTHPARIVYLGDVDHESYWLELAPSYEALVSKLRPGVRGD
jgi:hypothetical protein